MPRYFLIDAGLSFDCALSDLIDIDWDVNHLAADFLLPHDETKALRVKFEGSTIVRLLDEMPLSTENDSAENDGLVPHHFAYRVEGARFADSQSTAWKEMCGTAAHYEFVTGWGCMDVLSGSEPKFEIVERD